MSAGVSQPGGAGTTIFIYDNASAANGANYTFAEIAAAFPADVISDTSNTRLGYKFLVSLQVGDTTTNAATTTLKDSNVTVKFQNTRTLLYRATQTTSWFTETGTKIGSGNRASGVGGWDITFGAATVLRGQHKWYGSLARQTTGAVTVSTNDDDGSDFVNALWQSSASGTSPLPMGSASGRISNVYNLDISHTTTAQVISNWGSVAAERITIAAPTPTAFFQGAAAFVTIKDVVFLGAPTQSDVRFTSALALNWKFIRPQWSGGVKLSSTAGVSIDADNGLQEMRLLDIKVVDRNGNGVPLLPVTLTDVLGTVVVNTATDSAGQVLFGSGITANAVCVIDHYLLLGVYLTRTRSPFTAKINTSDLAGYNENYLQRRYKFEWFGEDTGDYKDVADIVAVEDQSGAPTTWTELAVP